MMMFKRIFDRIVLLLSLLLLFRPIIIVGGKELWEIDGVTYLTPDDINLNNNGDNSSSNYRQSFCDEYKYMIDNNLEVKDALNGVKLNVLIISDDEEGYFYYNDNNNGIGATGIYANILEYIAQSANFTMNVTVAPYPTSDMNMTFTEQLVWGTHNYDIFVADWERSSERINLGINFVDEFIDSSYIIVRSIDDETNKTKVVWTNWLAPFTMSVWFVLLATIICSSFVHQFLEHLRKNAYDRSDNGNTSKNKSTKATIDNIYLSFLNFTQQFSYEPSSLSGKIFSISFVFWSMLIGAAYTANLASLLVERSTGGLVINTIQDAIDNKMNICVRGFSNMDEYFTKVYPESIPFMVKAKYRGELYDLLNEEECDIGIGNKQHYETIIMKEEYNPDCKLQWNGRKIKEVGGSFATKSDPGIKCTSLIAEVFNFYTNKMITDGYLEELWNTHEAREATRDTSCYDNTIDNIDVRRRNLNGKASNDSHRSLSSISASGSIEDNSDDIDAEPLNLNQMAGTFLLHVVGSTISIIVGLLSFWNKKRRRRNKKKARQGQVESSPMTKIQQEEEDGEEVYTIKYDQEYPYSVEENNGGSRRSQLQQFKELTKRMDDMHTLLSLMAATKTKET